MGRPKLKHARDKHVDVRLSAPEFTLIAKAARDTPLSEWARGVLIAEAERVVATKPKGGRK